MSMKKNKKNKTKDNHSLAPVFNIFKHARIPYVLIIINCVIALLLSQLMIMFPDYTSKVYEGNFEIGVAISAVLIILGEAFATALLQYVGGVTVAKVKYSLREYIWKKLTRLPLAYFEKNEPKDFISRLTTDMNSISDFLAFSISGAVSTIYAFFGAFIMLFGYDYRLALSQLVVIPLCYLIGIIGGRVYFHFQNKVQGGLSDMTNYVAGVLSNLSLVKLFGQEKKEEKQGYFWINTYFKRSMEYNYAASAVEFANALVQIVQTLVVILFGVYLIRREIITIDVWIAFYLYADMIFSRFNSMMEIWKGFKQSQGALSRVSEAVNVEEEISQGNLPVSTSNDLSFENVSFAYEKDMVLKNVSFKIKANAMNALVGPSGSGKSTILLLMDQLYSSYQGNIILDGHEARNYELSAFRNQFCYIEQETPLFGGTVRDNILYGLKGEVSEEELLSACKKSGAFEFIEALPKGLDSMMLVAGNNFSGGQKQRLALTRAMLTDRTFILLDESLASVDMISAKQVFKELKELTSDKTIIFVTHSMEMARLADEIIVISDGEIKGSGSANDIFESGILNHVFGEAV